MAKKYEKHIITEFKPGLKLLNSSEESIGLFPIFLIETGGEYR